MSKILACRSCDRPTQLHEIGQDQPSPETPALHKVESQRLRCWLSKLSIKICMASFDHSGQKRPALRNSYYIRYFGMFGCRKCRQGPTQKFLAKPYRTILFPKSTSAALSTVAPSMVSNFLTNSFPKQTRQSQARVDANPAANATLWHNSLRWKGTELNRTLAAICGKPGYCFFICFFQDELHTSWSDRTCKLFNRSDS